MKAVTDESKKLRGTYRRDRSRTPLTFDPLETIPDPMEPLDQLETKYYYYLAELLLSKEALTHADIPGLTMASGLYAVYFRSMKAVKEEGFYQTTASGYSQKSAPFQTMMDTAKALREFESLYGLNLSSRGKMNLQQSGKPGPDSLDEFDMLLQDLPAKKPRRSHKKNN